MTRQYQLKRRAERQEKTRQRIVEATIALHQTVGGVGATISAIAALAGVERPTVYRHFPDERALLTACTGHYLAVHPPPDPATWQATADAATRLRTALTAVYTYHRQTAPMMAHAVHDVTEMPTLREVLAPLFAYWAGAQEILLVGWPQTGEAGRYVRAAIGHALSFRTWHSLACEQELDDTAAVDLMVALVCAAAEKQSE